MLAIPVATPVTTPEELTVAIAGLLLLHVPPDVEFPNAVVSPTQVTGVPVFAAMVLFTVTVVVRWQPDGNV